ncbi:MAG: hypothetical protein JO329_27365, partial [Planctomycetaceae bacterium]|nr:hypothetical protein [Planctomycetaceae bacterium]
MKKFRRSVFGAAWLGALAVTVGGADTASARWFSHGSGGSWGSYGSSGGSGGSWGSYGSSGGSGGSWG